MLVIVVVFNAGLVIAGTFGPLTNVHSPVPGDGLFPAMVVEVTLHKFCAGPALDTTGL